MSQYIEQIPMQMANSHFTFIDHKTVEAENVAMLWKNFSGKENQFGKCQRNFNIALPEDVASELAKLGCNVNQHFDKETNQKMFDFVNVKVNMESAYPPVITVYTDYNGVRSHASIDSDTISSLDTIHIISADCILNIYASAKNPDHPSVYLKKLNIIQNKIVEFGGKYDNWDDKGTPTKEDEGTDVRELAIKNVDKPTKVGQALPMKNVDDILADGDDKPTKKAAK